MSTNGSTPSNASGATPEQIEADVARQREQLAATVNELQAKRRKPGQGEAPSRAAPPPAADPPILGGAPRRAGRGRPVLLRRASR